MVNIKLQLYFPGWVGWVGVGVKIIKPKANPSSTSHLTSQLELSLAKLNEVQDLEKCDRQTEDGVTD